MNKLKHQGNLLEYIQGDCDIQILRVYGYESRPLELCYENKEERMKGKINDLFSLVWKNIPINWRDNKIVVECNIGIWRVFLGYWDSYRSIGFGVVPNRYLPKGNFNKWGAYEPINVSRNGNLS